MGVPTAIKASSIQRTRERPYTPHRCSAQAHSQSADLCTKVPPKGLLKKGGDRVDGFVMSLVACSSDVA